MAQLVSREDAQRHRQAVAARFGERIAAGDAAFMSAAFDGIAPALPVTVVGGEPRAFGGFNRWMLAQVMRDRKWADPRFFTAEQVEREGWSLAPGAPAVVLQFVSAVDGQGRAEAPKIMRVPVYNAAAIDGAPPMSPEAKLRPESLAQALQDAYIEAGANPATALADWVREIRREVAWPRASNAPYVEALADAMAIAAIASRVDVEPDQALAQTTALLRAQADAAPDLFKRDAAAFFAAVKVAELCSARAISLVEKAEVSRAEFASLEAPKHMEPAASHGEQMSAQNSNGRRTASPRVQALYEGRQAVLAVPFKEKDEASRLGAVFYPPLTVWFVPQGVDLKAFQKWDASGHCLGEVASEREIIEQFRRDMEALGLEAPLAIEADGRWHNVKITNHAKGKKPKSGAYLLNLKGGNDGTPRGLINNKYSGESMPWAFEGPLLTPEQKARMREAVRQRAQEAEKLAAKARDVAAGHAGEIIAQGQSAERHPYVLRKGISAEGLCQVPGSVLLQYSEFKGDEGRSAIRPNEPYLLVPMSDYEGRLRAVQAINHDGSVKSFMRGAQKQGTALVLGAPSLKALCEAPKPAAAVAFAEGVATGASFRRPTGLPVVVCFDAGNMEVIAAQMARSLPMVTLPVLAVDNDQFHVEGALGLLAARLGIDPNSGAGSTVEVLSGAASTRLVSLGDAIADGEWHQAPRGRYRMSLEREPDSTEVRSIEMQILVEGDERANTFTLRNRGVEAGRAARASFDLARPTGKQAVMVVPEFRDLTSRPTDWNDLAKLQGFGAVGQQAKHVIDQHLPREPKVERAEPARPGAGVSR
jgi:phage/plasmid primase-like uncharacterized protein